MPKSQLEHAPRRGLNRKEAELYIGVSERTFDKLVEEGAMPRPKRIGARAIWDMRALDRSFERLPGSDLADEPNDWDQP